MRCVVHSKMDQVFFKSELFSRRSACKMRGVFVRQKKAAQVQVKVYCLDDSVYEFLHS